MRDGQTTEDRATQPMEAAIFFFSMKQKVTDDIFPHGYFKLFTILTES